MYAWIWRKLPFGLYGKLTGSVVLITAVGALLWFVVFPWATPMLPFDDVQVGSTTGQDNAPAEQDPDTVTGDEAELGPDEIPYDVHSNAPDPSATPSR
ncbi:MAG TPA: hypothetical protein VF657_26045 [Actinoplanes sp.]|jgi:hypothetical protein